jgi:hypothetical protein
MKMKVGLSLEEVTVKRIEALAEGTRRDKSAIVDMAVELLSQQDEFSDLAPKTKRPARKSARRSFSPDTVPGVQKGLEMATA